MIKITKSGNMANVYTSDIFGQSQVSVPFDQLEQMVRKAKQTCDKCNGNTVIACPKCKDAIVGFFWSCTMCDDGTTIPCPECRPLDHKKWLKNHPV